MNARARHTPRTPMEALRLHLSSFTTADAAFNHRMELSFAQLRRQGLPVLGEHLIRPGLPALRKAILAFSAKHDWPEWTPWIYAALRAEADLSTFDQGCVALGQLGLRESLGALNRLLRERQESDRQIILNRELNQWEVPHPTNFYLGRLMEGRRNPRLASQGAKLVAAKIQEDELALLFESFQGGDDLVRQLILRMLPGLGFGSVVPFLTRLFEEYSQSCTEFALVQETLRRLATLPRPSARQECVNLVSRRFADKARPAIVNLNILVSQEEADAGPTLEALRECAEGRMDAMVLDLLELNLEGKIARFSAYIAEKAEDADQQLQAHKDILDRCAQALLACSRQGLATPEDLLPAFHKAFADKVGGDDFIQAYACLIPPDRRDLLDQILAEPDYKRRLAVIDAIGGREEDGFCQFLLKASQDPIVEVGQRAIHYIERLPSGFVAVMDRFESGDPDQVRLAIHIFAENGSRLAVEPLLQFIQGDQRDDLLVEAVTALGVLNGTLATEVLLSYLHDGKPLSLQVALAKALGQFETEKASLGLLERAPTLKYPQVLILALEGCLAGFPSFERPFPSEQLPAFSQLFERCCTDREGEGNRLRAILCTTRLFSFDAAVYEHLKSRFGDILFEMRTKEDWDRESNDRVAEVIKELSKRSANLGMLSRKEADIRLQLSRIQDGHEKGAPPLLALRSALEDPELILRQDLAHEISDFVSRRILEEVPEWRILAHLCEIGGIIGDRGLTEGIRDIHFRATGLGLKSAARQALQRLGLTESDIDQRQPPNSLLILEPSAFFRKRMAQALACTNIQILQASKREEADALLCDTPVDLLISELHDPAGDLSGWLLEAWRTRRFRHLILCPSSRDLGPIHEVHWLAGLLYKPFSMEQLVQAVAE